MQNEKNRKEKEKLTIVVCSNRSNKLRRYSIPSLIKSGLFFRVLIILDNSIRDVDNDFLESLKNYKNIEVIKSEATGLSNLRNIALDRCGTDYILFIDDDITISDSSIKTIINCLDSGFGIVGLRLKPPYPSYTKRWFLTPNQSHYLGFHAESNNSSIWGACMAFNMKAVQDVGLRFSTNLGRQKNKFLSGEDTSFIGELITQGVKFRLVEDCFVTHHVDKSRLGFINLTRRVFWQGITESVRFNIKIAIDKELKRNFQIVNLRAFILGLFWFPVFFLGLIYGFFYRYKHR